MHVGYQFDDQRAERKEKTRRNGHNDPQVWYVDDSFGHRCRRFFRLRQSVLRFIGRFQFHHLGVSESLRHPVVYIFKMDETYRKLTRMLQIVTARKKSRKDVTVLDYRLTITQTTRIFWNGRRAISDFFFLQWISPSVVLARYSLRALHKKKMRHLIGSCIIDFNARGKCGNTWEWNVRRQ